MNVIFFMTIAPVVSPLVGVNLIAHKGRMLRDADYSAEWKK
jgi:hypothetical protein